MNDSIEIMIERSSKFLKSKNILIAVIIILVFYIFFIEHCINHENKNLLITNDLYYLSKQIQETFTDKNPNMLNSKEGSIEKNSNEKNNKDFNKDKEIILNNNIEKKKLNDLISIKAIETCSKTCDNESEINKKSCFNQCLIEFEAENKNSIHSQYVFILFIILIAFVCSFFSYIKKNLSKFNYSKDYSNFVQRHLLEGYDLLNE